MSKVESDLEGMPPVEVMLQVPEVRDFALELLDELQNEAELESLFERADQEMALDLMYSHRYTEDE